MGKHKNKNKQNKKNNNKPVVITKPREQSPTPEQIQLFESLMVQVKEIIETPNNDYRRVQGNVPKVFEAILSANLTPKQKLDLLSIQSKIDGWSLVHSITREAPQEMLKWLHEMLDKQLLTQQQIIPLLNARTHLQNNLGLLLDAKFTPSNIESYLSLLAKLKRAGAKNTELLDILHCKSTVGTDLAVLIERNKDTLDTTKIYQQIREQIGINIEPERKVIETSQPTIKPKEPENPNEKLFQELKLKVDTICNTEYANETIIPNWLEFFIKLSQSSLTIDQKWDIVTLKGKKNRTFGIQFMRDSSLAKPYINWLLDLVRNYQIAPAKVLDLIFTQTNSKSSITSLAFTLTTKEEINKLIELLILLNKHGIPAQDIRKKLESLGDQTISEYLSKNNDTKKDFSLLIYTLMEHDLYIPVKNEQTNLNKTVVFNAISKLEGDEKLTAFMNAVTNKDHALHKIMSTKRGLKEPSRLTGSLKSCEVELEKILLQKVLSQSPSKELLEELDKSGQSLGLFLSLRPQYKEAYQKLKLVLEELNKDKHFNIDMILKGWKSSDTNLPSYSGEDIEKIIQNRFIFLDTQALKLTKEAVFDYIKLLPDDEKIKALIHAVIQEPYSHTLHQFMSISRGLKKTDISKGMLKKCKDELDKTLLTKYLLHHSSSVIETLLDKYHQSGLPIGLYLAQLGPSEHFYQFKAYINWLIEEGSVSTAAWLLQAPSNQSGENPAPSPANANAYYSLMWTLLQMKWQLNIDRENTEKLIEETTRYNLFFNNPKSIFNENAIESFFNLIEYYGQQSPNKAAKILMACSKPNSYSVFEHILANFKPEQVLRCLEILLKADSDTINDQVKRRWPRSVSTQILINILINNKNIPNKTNIYKKMIELGILINADQNQLFQNLTELPKDKLLLFVMEIDSNIKLKQYFKSDILQKLKDAVNQSAPISNSYPVETTTNLYPSLDMPVSTQTIYEEVSNTPIINSVVPEKQTQPISEDKPSETESNQPTSVISLMDQDNTELPPEFAVNLDSISSTKQDELLPTPQKEEAPLIDLNFDLTPVEPTPEINNPYIDQLQGLDLSLIVPVMTQKNEVPAPKQDTPPLIDLNFDPEPVAKPVVSVYAKQIRLLSLADKLDALNKLPSVPTDKPITGVTSTFFNSSPKVERGKSKEEKKKVRVAQPQ